MASRFTTQCMCLSLFLVGFMASLAASSRTLGDTPMTVRHEQWMAQYGRIYTDQAEKEHRFKIFKNNVEYIESTNKDANRKYKLGLNGFADVTNEEFVATHNGLRHSTRPRGTTFRYENVSAAPTTMDWRIEGAVTPIKNQGQCGN